MDKLFEKVLYISSLAWILFLITILGFWFFKPAQITWYSLDIKDNGRQIIRVNVDYGLDYEISMANTDLKTQLETLEKLNQTIKK